MPLLRSAAPPKMPPRAGRAGKREWLAATICDAGANRNRPRRATAQSISVGGDHLVGDFSHAGDSLGQRQKRLMLLGRSDETPKMHHLVGDDDVALAEIGPGLFGQPGEDGVPDVPVGLRILGRRLKAGLRRGERLNEIGAADDSDQLAVLDESEPV